MDYVCAPLDARAGDDKSRMMSFEEASLFVAPPLLAIGSYLIVVSTAPEPAYYIGFMISYAGCYLAIVPIMETRSYLEMSCLTTSSCRHRKNGAGWDL